LEFPILPEHLLASASAEEEEEVVVVVVVDMLGVVYAEIPTDPATRKQDIVEVLLMTPKTRD
jgi:hypothetical protein